MNVDPVLVALTTTSLFIAGIIKGTTGIGYVSCALPLLVATIGLKAAMAVVLVPAMATNIVVAFTAGQLRQAVQRMWPFYVAICPGVGLGLALLLHLDQRIAVGMLGATMIVYSLYSLAKPSMLIPPKWQEPLKLPSGFLNGVVTGLTGSQVVPLLPYVLGLHLAPSLTVQVINLAVIVSTVLVGIGLAASGLLTTALFGLSCAAVIPAVIGAYLGSSLRARLPAEMFRKIALATFAVMGASMLLRG